MKDKKAIIIDLDGTLFNSDKTISQNNLEIINRCISLDYIIIIATARPLRTVKKRLPIELNYHYLVLCNGAWIIKDDEIIYRNEIKSEIVLGIKEKLVSHGFKPSIEADNCFFTDSQPAPHFEGHYFPLNAYKNTDACKILSYMPDGANKDMIKEFIPDNLTITITDGDTLVQISTLNCTKLTACRKIFEIERVYKKNTYAFGDDNNDIPVFEFVEAGIAMQNATNELKKIAKYITFSNDNDGVGKGIEKYILL